MAALDRHFLGWDRPAMDLAVEWLVGRFGADLSQVTVALPGARAGRLLMQKLREAQSPDWQPPQVVTTGRLTDVLVRLECPSASRLVRTLAWEQALRRLATKDIQALVASRPADQDGKTWRGLANEVRGVFAVLSAECMDFCSVSAGIMTSKNASEQKRWQALARAQELVDAFLQEAGLCDPHRGRLEALDRGDLVDVGREVVLVGVVDAIGLVRRLVAALERVNALVFAPEETAEAFDDMGCVSPESWLKLGWALPLDAWRVAVGPDDQAQQALEVISAWNGRYSAEQITLGIGDGEVVPFLERRLGGQDVYARDAEGASHGSTPPAKLLAGVAAFLGSRRFSELADLVRHPHVEDVLTASVDTGELTCAEILDGYHNRHLPSPMPSPWLDAVDRRDADRNRLAGQLGAAAQDWLAPLSGTDRPLSQWAEPVREVLAAVYGERELDPTEAEDRLIQVGLTGFATALTSVEDLPGIADPDSSAAEALELLLAEAAANRIPPRAPELGEPSVEMLGWLELAFDEAPALVVTGFNEGFIPQTVKADGWLPDSLRAELGLPDDRSRLARDRFILQWLIQSREEACVISARRSLVGDPLRPSRLAFHGSPQEVLERVRHFLPGDTPPFDPTAASEAVQVLALPDGLQEPKAWSASAFADFQRSPYLFALHRLAGLKTLDDRSMELDPLLFGNLGHEILQQFAVSGPASSTEPEVIVAFLEQALDEEFSRRFGQQPLPAVQLQRRQLAWRLRHFAERQAAWAGEGWAIEHAEWKPAARVTLDLDGSAVALSGRIDRIDRNADGRYAILDYKFGEAAKTPDKARLRDGEWIDIQLPLYAYLAREVIGEAVPCLGYFNIGATPAHCGVDLASQWDEDALEAALCVAREVVREVRSQLESDQPVFPLGGSKIYDPLLAGVCGKGLLSLVGEEVDE